MDIKELDKSLQKILIKFMLDQKMCFISTALMSLNVIWNDKIPIARTNGLNIEFNPDLWEMLSPDDRIFILLHETWHVLYDHIARTIIAGFEKEKANIAADHEINLMLIDQGYPLPEIGGLADPTYKGLHFEAIYDLLPDSPQKPSMGDLDLDGECSLEEIQANSEKIQDIIMTAHTRAQLEGEKAIGNIPDSMLRHIESVKNPKLPWYVILHNYMNEKNQEDYSWRRPNLMFNDIYLPSLYDEGMGVLKVYEDLSGSITEKEHSLQIAELRFIQELLKPSEMTYNGFTTVLGETQAFTKYDEIAPDWDMCGGTAIEPVIKDIKESGAEVAIIFTDGYFKFPDFNGITTDIIWVIVNNQSFTCPVGKVIHMEI